MSERIIPALWGKAGISRNWATTHFCLSGLAWELSWHWWSCLLADVLQCVYDAAQGLLEVESSTLFDLVCSNQLLLCPVNMSFF